MTSAPPASTETAPAPNLGLRGERGPVLIAVMASVALVALDATVIATAVPSVVKDLGGFDQFPWLFSIYLLTQAVSVPIYGKLADQFGRKPMMLFGIGVFLLGSVLCGSAWSLGSLIAFRAVQGLGAGAVQPIAMTIIGDLYSVAERAKITGYVAGVWGASSVIGPSLGGLLTEYTSWRWIFWINIPVAVLAAWLLVKHFAERTEPTPRTVDYLGATLVAGGFGLLILGLLEGGVAWDWSSGASVAVLGAGVLLLVAAGFVERRAAEPVLPGWVFTDRVLIGANLAALTVGALLFAFSSYVPTYVQTVIGTGPLVAGLALAALTVGWPVAATYSGRIYLAIGFRATALIGTAFTLAGTLLAAWLLGPSANVWQVAGAMVVVGFGLGLVNSPLIVALQSAVGWTRRGVATGTNMFARSIGSALGVAVFGAVANTTLAHGTDRAHVATASQHVYTGLIVVAVLMIVAVLLVPRKVPAAE
ncbi:MDR family MFS transporter [Spongisporangium articulatum]|uniref:MDR family MFS transporter n=1 Tax=Spongisporangium articulatum TaxID=3362603 RepID=A0ABW8AL51_9ACTN